MTGDLVIATAEHARALAPELRPEELAELEAQGIEDPLAMMLMALRDGDCTLAGVVDGQVGALIGVAELEPSFMGRSSVGMLWFLTGRAFLDRPRCFLRLARRALDTLHVFYPVLHNVIDGRYTGALRLAAAMGAVFDWPVPFGPRQLPFVPFTLRRV